MEAILSSLLLLLGCGDKTEVRVPDAPPTVSAKDAGKAVTGDWLVIHSLSDPEVLNPLTSSDASSSEVNGYIFETLLTREPRTLELIPYMAVARPEISPDKLTLFQDSPTRAFKTSPAHCADVLFSARQSSARSHAPFLRSIQFARDAQLSILLPSFCHQRTNF